MVKYLSKKGFIVSRQKGSHVVLVKGEVRVTVPLHNELDRGTLNAILAEAGISKDEFLKDWYS
ncbi:MAG: type II toxin-antitoxin system HicA family toxin [Conexivisphaerales archaeon]